MNANQVLKGFTAAPSVAPNVQFNADLTAVEQAIARITTATSAVFADGKVAGAEYFQLFGELPDIQTLITRGKNAGKFFWSLADAEQDDVLNEIAAQTGDLPEKVKARVFAVLNAAKLTEQAVKKMVVAVQSVRAAFAPEPSADNEAPAKPKKSVARPAPELT